MYRKAIFAYAEDLDELVVAAGYEYIFTVVRDHKVARVACGPRISELFQSAVLLHCEGRYSIIFEPMRGV